MMSLLSACSSGGAAAGKTATTTAAAATAGTTAALKTAVQSNAAGGVADKTFGYVVRSLANPFYASLKETIATQIKRTDCLLALDSLNDINTELTNVDLLISQQVNAVFISCVDINGSVNSVNKLLAAGIPVAIVDSPSANRTKATFSVLSDNANAGYLAMAALDKALPEGAEVVNFETASAIAKERILGRDQYLGEHPVAMEIVNKKITSGSVDTGFAAMNDLLQSNPGLKGVWGINDASAQGAIAALKEAGKQAGEIAVAGIDGSAESAKLIIEGWQLGTSACYPQQLGKTAVEEMYKVMDGHKPVKQDIRIPVVWIDESNIHSYTGFDQK